jgi:hypothetical protein
MTICEFYNPESVIETYFFPIELRETVTADSPFRPEHADSPHQSARESQQGLCPMDAQ